MDNLIIEIVTPKRAVREVYDKGFADSKMQVPTLTALKTEDITVSGRKGFKVLSSYEWPQNVKNNVFQLVAEGDECVFNILLTFRNMNEDEAKKIFDSVLSSINIKKPSLKKPVLSSQETLEKTPAPKSIFHRPKDVPENQKTPLVIFLHGMGGCPAEAGKGIIPMADSLKYSVLLPCGSIKMGMSPDGLPMYNWNFITDLDAIVNEVKALKNINLQQVYISGFSAGASMAMIGGLKSPDFYSGVIAFSGTLQDDALATIKITPASNKIPFYIIHGTADQVMPFELAKNAEKYLQSKNYPVTLISFEGGHTPPRNYVDIFKQAINSFSAQKQKAGK